MPVLPMKSRYFLIVVVALLSFVQAQAADVGFFGIIKSQEYVQTNSAAPVGRTTNGFAFNAFVLANSNNVLTNATVKLSNGTPPRQLSPQDTNTLTTWRFEERFNTSNALEVAYPVISGFTPARYTNTLFTLNDGIKSVTLNYSGCRVVFKAGLFCS